MTRTPRPGVAFPSEPPPVRAKMRDTAVEAGPATELERVYREHGARLWRALLAFTGDREVASDALAEAFAQALGRGTAIRSPLRWIWRSAFQIARGELKARRRRPALEPERSYLLPEPDPEVVQALARLPRGQRAAVVLHHVADYPAGEVARILGSTAPAVRMQLTRGRRRLRQLLEGSDE
jgi:RNA polymerase sigma-70 factor (ECF subfamily)